MKQETAAKIETSRLILNQLRADDDVALFSYRGDPEVVRYQGWQPSTIAEAADFIAKQASLDFGVPGSWYQLAIRDRASGELVGDFGIHFPQSKDDAIEFGVSLPPKQQGKGIAREVMRAAIGRAFGSWGYRRIVGSVDPRNLPSVALVKALGFRLEAHHVESLYLRGEWVDDMIFALLAREWPSAGKQR